MAIVVNRGNAYEPVDHHWHADANEVHGSGGDGIPGASGSDMITATGGTVARSLSDWCADILYDDSGAMIPLGSPCAWHVKRGTFAAPITSSSPTLRIDKYENISAATQPNPVDNANNAAIVLIGEAIATSDTQICGLWSEQRGGGDVTSADVAGMCGIGWVVHDVPRFGGNYFEGRKTYTQNGVHAVELRATNLAATPDSYNSVSASKSMGAWATPNGAVGANCAGAYVAGHLGTNKWDVGFACTSNSVVSAAFRDDSSSTTSVLIFGTHTDGINMAYAVVSGSAIALPNNKYIKAFNAASSAFVNCIGLDSANQIIVGQAGTNVYSPGTLMTSSGVLVTSAAATAAGLDFWEGGSIKWQLHKGADNSLYLWDYDAAGIVIQFGAGATKTIGFFGVTPVVRQTVGAALSTGGAETNTNLATRINQLRTAMINLGLAV